MILSLRQIEDIGAAVIQDFNKFFYCGSNALTCCMSQTGSGSTHFVTTP